jgi:3-oxoacyl-[acyl-carrier-protein] synthase II
MATVVGANTLNAYEYASMDAVRVLSPSGARPFDPERDGTTIGEGGGALVLERAEDAAARGRLPLARLAGVACRVGGNSRSGVDHAIAAECLEAALAAAGQPEIDYVHAHATGTPQGDETELEVLAAVAGRHGWDDEIPVSSNKGAVGHLLYASMFPGIAAALTALRTGAIPGTPGLEAPRRDGPLRVLGRPERRARAANVLVDAFGFGGNNSALVLSA